MSRSISESLSLLSETLGNCKTNLKEKSVENVDNIKISDVDEKIAEIQAGGGGKAIVVIVPSFTDPDQVEVRISSRALTLSKSVDVYTSSRETKKINIYELEPSQSSYHLTYDGYEYPFISNEYYTFDEPKLYFLDCKNIDFYS